MARYKPVHRNRTVLPVVLDEQIQPGTFEFALDHLVDHELDLSALDARFRNDETGASAYDPRVMLKIVLLAYSRGLISSRAIERACAQNVLFMALQRRRPPQLHPHCQIRARAGRADQRAVRPGAADLRPPGPDRRHMFAIDGVKLPANASKERSGTHAELRHRADSPGQGRSQDRRAASGAGRTRRKHLDSQRQVAHRRAAPGSPGHPRVHRQPAPSGVNRKGSELKTNVTDPDSAKMATSKGVIQGYAAQAAVDSAHQVIVGGRHHRLGLRAGHAAADDRPGSEPARQAHTLITADAGYYSDEQHAAHCTSAASPRWWPTTPCASATSASPTKSRHKAKTRRCTTSARRHPGDQAVPARATSASTATTPPPARPARPSPATAACTRTPAARRCSSSRPVTKTAGAAHSGTAA